MKAGLPAGPVLPFQAPGVPSPHTGKSSVDQDSPDRIHQHRIRTGCHLCLQPAFNCLVALSQGLTSRTDHFVCRCTVAGFDLGLYVSCLDGRLMVLFSTVGTEHLHC